MDEPTTHLDMASIDALIQALDQYEGTLIFISHDVHFIRALARKVLHIDTGRLTPYAGGYDYYLEKSKATDAREALTVAATRRPRYASRRSPRRRLPTSNATARKSKEQKRAEAEARSAVSRDKREREERVRRLEREISNLEARQKAITAETGGRIDLPAARPSDGTQPGVERRRRPARPHHAPMGNRRRTGGDGGRGVR